MRAIDVANFFIDLVADDPEEAMTNLRVNKLLYFAQGWYLARYKEPLFDDPIEAWQYGPVVSDVYHTFSVCGHNKISSVSGAYSHENFTEEQLTLLLDVAREYGKYTSSTLVTMTHKKGTPWESIYSPSQKNEITTEDLKQYFSSQEPLPTFEVDDIDDDDAIIGHRDPATGFYVLPADWS